MARKQLGFETLVRIAVAEAATTPNPGTSGVWAWSTTISQPVMWDGSAWRSTQNAITVSSTEPSSPYEGQLWLDTST